MKNISKILIKVLTSQKHYVIILKLFSLSGFEILKKD
jgi:hypothetical protein